MEQSPVKKLQVQKYIKYAEFQNKI